MANDRLSDGIVVARLVASEYQENFSDLHPPLDTHSALVDAERCYFCYDAPCTRACPTEIDIPMFIRQISTGDVLGSAKTIFDQNILGGMCARVCPTETLCEEACVREAAEGKPVNIGLLQRYATDKAIETGRQFYSRATFSGQQVAIVGAGPAGLACAHRLSMYGHNVVVYDGREKPGGLNEYGIAAYKTTNDFAQREVDYVTAIGGIDIKYNQWLGRDVTLDELSTQYEAVFLAVGLAGVNTVAMAGGDADGVQDAVKFIATIRQADDLQQLSVGRRVVVIGGGMTAIDVAVQSKLLGAEEVTVCYRGDQSQMKASQYEQRLAAQKGVLLRYQLRPKKIISDEGKLVGIEFEYRGSDQTITLAADQIFKAIGQTLDQSSADGLKMERAKVWVDSEGRTSLPNVWAGGDCVASGEDLTVSAVAMGRDSAERIHHFLSEKNKEV